MRNQRRRYLGISVILAMSALACYLAYPLVRMGISWKIESAQARLFNDPARVAQDQQYCDTVLIPAIQRFHADRSAYPPSLQDLTPAYLPGIAPPTAGRPTWEYWPGDGTSPPGIGFGVGEYCYPCWFQIIGSGSGWELDI